MESVVNLAKAGCLKLAEHMKRELLQHTSRLATAKGIVSKPVDTVL